MLCGYGCGQEVIKQFKNGKFCCSESVHSCPSEVSRKSERQKGTKRPPETKGTRRKKSNSHKGLVPWNKDKKNVYSKELLERKRLLLTEFNPMKNPKIARKVSKKLKGRKNGPHTNESNESRKITMKKRAKDLKWIERVSNGTKLALVGNIKEKQRKIDFMKNGGAVYALSLNTNPSKPQVETWKRTCKICPYVYLNYPVTHLENTYSIDVAIPKLEIVIEFDGSYWHQNEEKDLRRQKELEEDGWNFLRYVDIIPTKEQLQKDIKSLTEKIWYNKNI